MKNNDFNIYCRILFLSVEDIMGNKLKALELQNVSIIHTSIYFLFVYFFISVNNITEDIVLPEPSRIRRGKL